MIDLNSIPTRSNGFIPEQVVVARVIGERVGKDKNGDPYVMLSTELVSPEDCTFTDKDGELKKVTIASRQATHFLGFGEGGLSRTKEFHVQCGLPLNVEPNNPNLKIYHGKAFFALLKCKSEAKKDHEGNPIVDPLTNQPVFNVSLNFSQIFGLCKDYCIDLPDAD